MLLVKILALAFIVSAIPIPHPSLFGSSRKGKEVLKPDAEPSKRTRGDGLRADYTREYQIRPPGTPTPSSSPPLEKTSPVRKAWNAVKDFAGRIFGVDKTKPEGNKLKRTRNNDPILNTDKSHDIFTKPSRTGADVPKPGPQKKQQQQQPDLSQRERKRFEPAPPPRFNT